ncbi:heterokaryon incompatibility protein-domain-containing protein [Echria macrotheca]|uniref:Heterokaryon incompatibility protein-domain-containing protein n=1 Tax=Echria macrotheca TaxID=438768 RepID=A0AAJ0B8I7_9PEZI|nr:heterokaryon incompatibility protein-domain-containing protein [Echria macrotheca]
MSPSCSDGGNVLEGQITYHPLTSSPGVSICFEDSVCGSCQSLVDAIVAKLAATSSPDETDKVEDRRREWPHHDGSVPALLISAGKCNLCRIISKELGRNDSCCENYTVEVPQDKPNGTSFRVIPKTLPHQLSPAIERWDFRLYQRVESSTACQKDDGHSNNKFLLPGWYKTDRELTFVPGNYPDTPEVARTVQGWMDRCKTSHPSCSRTRVNSPLPKRILDLSAPDGKIHLYESKGETVPYATLSYCWGKSVALKTTASNYSQHLQGIRLDAFPRTLRECIPLCKSLGFRYLWIDALCIIQDDPLDWAQQSAAMTAIYHGGSLNIAVTDSVDCDEGVVRETAEFSAAIGTLRSVQVAGSSSDIEVGDAVNIRVFGLPKPGIHPQNESVLYSRGWVLQESLVSVATLFITHNYLVWECCSERCEEGLEPSEPFAGIHPTRQPTLKASWLVANNAWLNDLDLAGVHDHWGVDMECWVMSRPLRQEWFRIWYYWVAHLSRRRLTFSTDKLPSLAGLASKLATSGHGTYVAGLWKEDLIIGLSWFPQGTLIRHKARAPSWSWASVDGPFGYLWCLMLGTKFQGRRQMKEDLDLHITEDSVTEMYPGSFGEVRGGSIEAIGTVWPSKANQNPSIKKELTFEGVFDGHKVTIGKGTLGQGFFLDEGHEEFDYETASGCRLLWITSIRAEGASSSRCGPFLIFLIIQETGERENEYRRIGAGWVNQSPGKHWQNKPKTLLADNGQRMPIRLV